MVLKEWTSLTGMMNNLDLFQFGMTLNQHERPDGARVRGSSAAVPNRESLVLFEFEEMLRGRSGINAGNYGRAGAGATINVVLREPIFCCICFVRSLEVIWRVYVQLGTAEDLLAVRHYVFFCCNSVDLISWACTHQECCKGTRAINDGKYTARVYVDERQPAD
jgi:hypothetical protein